MVVLRHYLDLSEHEVATRSRVTSVVPQASPTRTAYVDRYHLDEYGQRATLGDPVRWSTVFNWQEDFSVPGSDLEFTTGWTPTFGAPQPASQCQSWAFQASCEQTPYRGGTLTTIDGAHQEARARPTRFVASSGSTGRWPVWTTRGCW